MKEAAGEANMTVVTIIIIAIVLAIGSVIITNLLGNVKEDATDINHGCPQGQYWDGKACVSA